MRAKLGGRYAKYAKVSNSTELPKSTLLKPENNKSPKANPKQERNASLDEGNIKSYIEYFESFRIHHFYTKEYPIRYLENVY